MRPRWPYEYPYAVRRYAYLGPAGTFTEEALRTIAEPSDELHPYANVTAALNAVRNSQADQALVPIENSVEGVVARTLDELAIGEPLVIYREITLPVSFSLLVAKGKESSQVKKIATHPHAEAQCRSFIAKNYPDAEIIPTSSTAAAAADLVKSGFDAAIASPAAAKEHGDEAKKLQKEIEAQQKEIDRRKAAMKEEVKPMKPPFNAPYKKAAGDVKDKSGAVHTAASRAKHLAKTGMKTQTPVKEGVFGALAGGVLGGLCCHNSLSLAK